MAIMCVAYGLQRVGKNYLVDAWRTALNVPVNVDIMTHLKSPEVVRRALDQWAIDELIHKAEDERVAKYKADHPGSNVTRSKGVAHVMFRFGLPYEKTNVDAYDDSTRDAVQTLELQGRAPPANDDDDDDTSAIPYEPGAGDTSDADVETDLHHTIASELRRRLRRHGGWKT